MEPINLALTCKSTLIMMYMEIYDSSNMEKFK